MKQEEREGTGMEMEEKLDCQVFEDQLDALVRGELPEEGMRQLRLHADMCPECGLQLKVQENLLGPSLEVLEEQVPQALLASVWEGVESGVAGRKAGAQAMAPEPRLTSFNWFVPALAAATVALLFSTGFLAVQNRRLTEESSSLTQQVTEQQRWMAELGSPNNADPVARTASLAGRNPFARALSREESISISGLRGLLERMPGDRMVLNQAQMDDVLRSRSGLSLPLFRDVLAGMDTRDGLRARELLRALDALEVSPDFMVPTADLMEILS